MRCQLVCIACAVLTVSRLMASPEYSKRYSWTVPRNSLSSCYVIVRHWCNSGWHLQCRADHHRHCRCQLAGVVRTARSLVCTVRSNAPRAPTSVQCFIDRACCRHSCDHHSERHSRYQCCIVLDCTGTRSSFRHPGTHLGAGHHSLHHSPQSRHSRRARTQQHPPSPAGAMPT